MTSAGDTPIPKASNLSAFSANLRLEEDSKPILSSPGLGSTIDQRFLLLDHLGRGGMSVVYRARHLVLDRIVAVKLLHPKLINNEETRERFQQEARAASSLDHPNIIKVLAFGLDQGENPYLAMDFINGQSLSDYLQASVTGETVAERQEFVRRVFMQICDALHHAHSRGIIHRDLKPSNCILTVDENAPLSRDFNLVVKVVDFGVARILPQAGKLDRRLTKDGSTCGSPPYMSPEQCTGDSVDARSDIYSLGCMLYESVTGQRPFVADTAAELMLQHLKSEPQAPSELVKAISPQLEQIILRCLAKSPVDRFQSMAELKACLENLDLKGPSLGRATDTWTVARKKKVKRPLAVGQILLASFVTFSFLGLCGLFAYLNFDKGGRLLVLKAQSEVDRSNPQADPAKVGAMLREIASLSEQLGRPDEAETYYRQYASMLKKSPNRMLNPQALEQLGDFYSRQGMRARAREAYFEAAKAYDDSANSLLYHKDIDAAEKALMAKVALYSKLPQAALDRYMAYQQLAVFQKLQRRYEGALASMQAGLDAYRSSGQAKPLGLSVGLQTLAYIYLDQKKIDQALPLLAEAFELSEARSFHERVEIGRVLAQCYSAKGQFGRAQSVLAELNTASK